MTIAIRGSLVCLVACALGSLAALPAAAQTKISFKKTAIEGVFRSEGCAIGDFNHDGKMDISAGSVYFAAPDWKLVSVLEKPKETNPAGYSDTFCNYADDVNGDGWTDLIVVDFPGKQTWWFENPKEAGGAWARHEMTPETNNESPLYVDMNGDGVRELICGLQGGKMGYVTRPSDVAKVWTATSIAATNKPNIQKFYHGIGLGDINKDGRQDVLCPEGWWEAPATAKGQPWTFHQAPFGEACAQMYAYDFDGDGDNDVLSSSAHRFGIWWYEQTPEGWQKHEIDSSFSQTHALMLADVNGDGLQDFITGKRWWAHGAKGDPGSDQPAVLHWFELSREGGKPIWKMHQIDHDSGIGTQFDVADVNGDKLLDIAVSNKKGTFYFEQVRE